MQPHVAVDIASLIEGKMTLSSLTRGLSSQHWKVCLFLWKMKKFIPAQAHELDVSKTSAVACAPALTIKIKALPHSVTRS